MLLPLLAMSGAHAELPLEPVYAEFNDAFGAVSFIDSDPARFPGQVFDGKTRAAWERLYIDDRARLNAGLAAPPGEALSPQDRRAVDVMREAVDESPETPRSLAPVGHCSDAQRIDTSLEALQEALYACFTERANALEFEGAKVTRVAAFELLTHIPEEPRRKALFMAFKPLWAALNAGGKTSPYRRMILLAAQRASDKGSPIDAAAGTLGLKPAEIERWLVQILTTWSGATGPDRLEPWNYRFEAGTADRELAALIPRDSLARRNQVYFGDLGLDVAGSKVVLDLDPRVGKAPLAYTDYVRRGRMIGGVWKPTLVRISASYGEGGLGPLNELVHESGHASHMLALRTRPAFMDLGDPLFYEAFADVPSWSVYEPAWQQKYLGKHTDVSSSLRALYSNVMLDVAWALFDLRMLREPQADPDILWTDITDRYLHIQPHPELSWWAMRVQLVHKPGYMVNYGLGAVITADIRDHVRRQIGAFDAGNPRWFAWLSDNLLASGQEHPTVDLLRTFLGRPVAPDALLQQLRRIAPASRSATAPQPGNIER